MKAYGKWVRPCAAGGPVPLIQEGGGGVRLTSAESIRVESSRRRRVPLVARGLPE